MSFKVTGDTLSPALAKMVRDCGNPKPILEAMGNAGVSLTKRAFNDEALRPMPWPPVKKQGGAPLKRSGAMWQSIRITGLTSNYVTFGTDRPYAPYHQFGTRPYEIVARLKKALFWPGAKHPVKGVHHPGLPARPFFPFDAAGNMTPTAKQKVEAAAKVALAKLLKP
jgi:phage gpG-like protein